MEKNDFFEKLVKDCRENESSQIINNSSMAHACILIKNLFISAHDRLHKGQKPQPIKIVTDTLKDDVYKELTDDIEACLNSGCQVDLIVLNPERDLATSSFYQKVKASRNGKIRQAKHASALSFPNFIVVGDNKFRFEQDKAKAIAIGCFDNATLGHNILNVFKFVEANIA